MKSEREGINLNAKPSGTGCVECLTTDGWWLHLRRCAVCGHIGCCDSSSSQHASKHNATTDHPIINSFEPGEDWFYDSRLKIPLKLSGKSEPLFGSLLICFACFSRTSKMWGRLPAFSIDLKAA